MVIVVRDMRTQLKPLILQVYLVYHDMFVTHLWSTYIAVFIWGGGGYPK